MAHKPGDSISQSRRSYLKSAAGTATAGTLLAGCLGDDDGVSEIIMGSYEGSWQEAMIEAAVEPFEEETGVSVDYVLGDNRERVNRLVAQSDDPPVDVTQLDGPALQQGLEEDIWMEQDSDLVSYRDNIPDDLNPDHWTIQIFTASVLQYNTDTFDSAPDSFGVYLDPEYEGRVGLYTEDPTYDLMAFSLYQTDGQDPLDIDAAFDMYEEVVAEMDPIFMESSDEYGSRWANDELDIGRYWQARAVAWRDEGSPVGYTIPENGVMMQEWGNAIPKNTSEERVEVIGEFLDYCLEESAAVTIADAMNYPSPRTDVEYPEEMEEDLITGDDLEDIQAPDWETIGRERDDWTNRMRDIIDEHT